MVNDIAATKADEVQYTGPLQDVIHLHEMPQAQLGGAAKSRTRCLVFLISGNPGLIEYYRSFLTLLKDDLAQADERNNDKSNGVKNTNNVAFEFYGHSMAGFEVQAATAKDASTRQRNAPYSLQEQIEYMEERLFAIVQKTTDQADGVAPRVILIGHSVGSYILLELIRRHRERLEATSESNASASEQGQNSSKKQEPHGQEVTEEPNIVGGIGLFPTIVDIGKSPQGQVFTSMLRIPAFPTIMSLVARVLSVLIPAVIIQRIVRKVEGMQSHPARVVTAFFTSPRSVKQALSMAHDEMRSITADKWDEEIWGAAHESPLGVPRPRLFFYFGQDDHWVADRTRDDIMTMRGRQSGNSEDWRPVMEIGDKGITHDFCIHHSAILASKCAQYIRSVVQADQNQRQQH